MENRPWIKYLVYLLLILAFVFLDSYVMKEQAIYRHQTFNIGLAYIVVSMIIKIAIGLLMGLEYITNEIKKEGKWKINIYKVVLIVIRSLYFSIVLFLYFIPNELLINVLMKPNFIIFLGQSQHTSIFQILLGYFLITSFYKQTAER